MTLDISDVKVEKNENHSNKIQVNDEYFLFMTYPTIDEYADIMVGEKSESEKSFNIMIKCMDKLVSETSVLNFKDFTEKEIQDFVDSMTGDIVKQIKNFFDTMPKIRFEINYKNSNKEDKKFIIQGTETFFI